jgi:rhodanese-related sulfurtransferase
MFARLNPVSAQALIESGAVEVVDVREPEEWSRGHIPGARLVSLAALRSDPKTHIPRDGVLFVCAGGVRSQTAARIAVEQGFTRIYSLTGGTVSWVKAGLPLTSELSVAV